MKPCCQSLEDAIRFGLLQEIHGEIVLPLRNLTDVNPEATAGNVITGEVYNPAEFQLTMSITFCPWCADVINEAAAADLDLFDYDPGETGAGRAMTDTVDISAWEDQHRTRPEAPAGSEP